MEHHDFTLIGAGIMSATLGVMLKQLNPDAKIVIYERLDEVAAESSNAWNNAGTGHSAFCELNYTPLKNGKIDVSKALSISEQYELSKQLWSYLKETGCLKSDYPFITEIDHMSFVWGDENVNFLKDRHEALIKYGMFEDMEFSTEHEKIKEWIPLVMNGRDSSQNVAATTMSKGTDVDFGAMTRGMINYLKSCDGVEVHLGHQVKDLEQNKNGKWKIKLKNLANDNKFKISSDFIFIGAGGAALRLLEKTDLKEVRGYGGFPVSGQFLRCTNPEVIAKHDAKVYGLAEAGSPPMSVPHLDSRMLDGKRSLLFGPYAGFSTKFLKNGSWLDLAKSLEVSNILPMLAAGATNVGLTKYLIKQVLQDPEERIEALKQYYPDAKAQDWELITAGQRVQIIKKDKKKGGKLQFGTEVVASNDKTMACLLGASPGASTSVSIMLDLLNKCFPEEMKSKAWKDKMSLMIPSLGHSLIKDNELCRRTRARTSEVLQLD